MRHSANNIIEVLIGHAEARPHHTAFIWLNDGENASETWDYAHFLQKVQHLAAQLAPLNLGGQRALLVFSTVQDFTLAFMASLYAGIVPVPVFFAGNKRYQAKLANIMADAQVAAVFTLAAHAKAMEPVLGDYWHQHGVRVVHTDAAAHGPAVALAPSPHPAIAFLQYTSGSTGQPKGVVITHHNLLHNQRVIEHAFTCDFDSVILSWLPFHHDMGLIGNILHSIYIGCSCVMMSPFHFVQQPLRWLKAVHRFRATHSGAPNFAFDLCVNKIAPAALDGLDLSCWRVAFNGAEPIKAATLDRFAALLAPTGFGSHAFFTCYGMAETTLMTTGWKPAHEPPLVVQVPNVAGIGYRLPLCSPTDPDSRTVVSSGTPPPGMHVTIAGPNGQPCGELETGEICVAGGSVTPGYWNRDSAAFFVDYNGQRHLKTGDTGFMYKGCLFVYGRLKEMLVIRGENFYPYDIEQSVAELSAHIEANGVAAFGVQIPDEELVVVVELKRTSLQTADTAALLRAIEQDVADGFGLVPHDIVLTTPLGIPRTSSGKLQRLQCQQLYHENAFQVVARKRAQAAGTSETIDIAALLQQAKAQPDYDHLLAYLTGLVTAKTGHRPGSDATDLTALGIDSLRAMELINTLNNDLGINMDVSAIFEHPTVAALARATEHLLWIKNGSATAGEEIEL